jgi:hypothetical protein
MSKSIWPTIVSTLSWIIRNLWAALRWALSAWRNDIRQRKTAKGKALSGCLGVLAILIGCSLIASGRAWRWRGDWSRGDATPAPIAHNNTAAHIAAKHDAWSHTHLASFAKRTDTDTGDRGGSNAGCTPIA